MTSTSTVFQRAIAGSTDYDDQFGALTRAGHGVDGADWEMVTAALEDEGLESFTQAFTALRGVLAAGAAALVGQETASA